MRYFVFNPYWTTCTVRLDLILISNYLFLKLMESSQVAIKLIEILPSSLELLRAHDSVSGVQMSQHIRIG